MLFFLVLSVFFLKIMSINGEDGFLEIASFIDTFNSICKHGFQNHAEPNTSRCSEPYQWQTGMVPTHKLEHRR